MSADAAERMHAGMDAVYRSESRRVLATLMRLRGDFDLDVESMPAQGARFVVELPITTVPVVMPRVRAPEASASLQGRAILVVDDEPEDPSSHPSISSSRRSSSRPK
jgi:hypothetical protein